MFSSALKSTLESLLNGVTTATPVPVSIERRDIAIYEL
jgi:hypothetical protein